MNKHIMAAAIFFTLPSLSTAGMWGYKTSTPNVFNYNYLDLNYIKVDIDEDETSGIDELDGFSISGALDITDNIAIYGRYQSPTSTESETNTLSATQSIKLDLELEYSILGIGALYHLQSPTNQNMDINFRVGIEKYEIKATANAKAIINDQVFSQQGASASEDETGLIAGAGVRYKLNNRFEVNGGATFYTEGPDGLEFGIGGRYSITEKLALQGQTSFGDNYNEVTLGVRYLFK